MIGLIEDMQAALNDLTEAYANNNPEGIKSLAEEIRAICREIENSA